MQRIRLPRDWLPKNIGPRASYPKNLTRGSADTAPRNLSVRAANDVSCLRTCR